MKYIIRLALLVLLALLSACGTTSGSTASGTGGIEVVDAWVRLPSTVGAGMGDMVHPTDAAHRMDGMATGGTAPAGDMGAMDMGGTGSVYMTIRNAGSTPDKLLSAKVDGAVASAAELHEDKVNADGVAQMRPVANIDIPANGEVQFKTGTYHVMLINPSAKLKAGDNVNVTLQFAQAGTKTVQATVRAQ